MAKTLQSRDRPALSKEAATLGVGCGKNKEFRHVKSHADLLPDRASLAKAISEVRGPHKVNSPNPEDQVQALEKFGRDLTADAASGKLDPVIGRDEEVRRVIQVL